MRQFVFRTLGLLVFAAIVGCGGGGGGAATVAALGVDTDGDGRSDESELAGYIILIDDRGFGPQPAGDEAYTVRHVTSDPLVADTDGDGLDDGVEWTIRSDPRDEDTDDDQLTDAEEWLRWKSSPVSVDTDCDARGPSCDLPPNALLFDGNELRLSRTSPTLDDTDGDGKTDYEEIDDPARNPLIAELPRLQLSVVGEVDVRLFVEYAETEGTETEYGSKFTTSTASTESTATMSSTATTTAASEGETGLLGSVLGGGLEDGKAGAAKAGGQVLLDSALTDCGSGISLENLAGPIGTLPVVGGVAGGAVGRAGGAVDNVFADVGGGLDSVFLRAGPASAQAEEDCGATPQVTETEATTLTESSTVTATEEFSEYMRDSLQKTEVASRGEVSVGIRVTNPGLFAYRVSDLFITMMQYQQSPSATNAVGRGLFRTLATLTPAAGADVVLGPGGSTPVIQMQARDVNPAVIKGFLENPTAVFYAPAGFELENQDNINFKFLTEQTGARSATIVIDYGDGTVQNFIVATNVDRADDTDPNVEQGTRIGLSMRRLFEEVLELPFTTTLSPVVTGQDATGADIVEDIRSLASVRGIANEYPDLAGGDVLADRATGTPGSPMRFWVIHPSRRELLDPAVHWDDLRVRPGDVVRFVYTRDEDGDGLFASEEAIHGTSESTARDDDIGSWAADGSYVPTPAGAPPAENQNRGLDTDLDQLTDYQEVKLGWRCIIRDGRNPELADLPILGSLDVESTTPGKTWRELIAESAEPPTIYQVYSNPTQSDADRDGLTDAQERALGTNPNSPDTDRDSLPDATDPLPLSPALRLYVSQSVVTPGNGSTWDKAFAELSTALADAKRRNDTAHPDYDERRVVGEIWVASGVYAPASRSESFELLPHVNVIGGFSGIETSVAERISDPNINACILSGDVDSDDAQQLRQDNNAWTVVLGEDIGPDASLDGFTIRGGWALSAVGTPGDYEPENCGGGIYLRRASPALRNLRVTGNHAGRGGGIFAIDSQPYVASCTFDRNQCYRPDGAFPETGTGAGAAIVGTAATAPAEESVFAGCVFDSNGGLAHLNPFRNLTVAGPGMDIRGASRVRLVGCVFARNRGSLSGGLNVAMGTVRAEGCTFHANTATGNPSPAGPWSEFREGGSAVQVRDVAFPRGYTAGTLECSLVQCLIVSNTGVFGAVGLNARTDLVPGDNGRQPLVMVNCTVTGNTATGAIAPTPPAALHPTSRIGSGVFGNPIFADTPTQLRPNATFALHNCIVALNGGTDRDVSYSGSYGLIVGTCVGKGVDQLTLGSFGSFTANPLSQVTMDFSGNIQADPLVVSPGDPRLLPGSPCIDTGRFPVDWDPLTPGLQLPTAVDIGGRTRRVDGDADGIITIDMGAYELQR